MLRIVSLTAALTLRLLGVLNYLGGSDNDSRVVRVEKKQYCWTLLTYIDACGSIVIKRWIEKKCQGMNNT